MDIPSTHITKTAQETEKLGEEMAHEIVHGSQFTVHSKNATVVCLYGELGGGKTVFARGFGRGLGLKQRILSPTFLLMRAYPIEQGGNFYHLDLYRVNSAQEIKDLGIKEALDNEKNIILIEWAERLHELLPKERIDIKFRVLGDRKHEIKIFDMHWK